MISAQHLAAFRWGGWSAACDPLQTLELSWFTEPSPPWKRGMKGTEPGNPLKKITSWCFFSHPVEKYDSIVKLDHFPRDRGENKTYLKPPTRSGSSLQTLGFPWIVPQFFSWTCQQPAGKNTSKTSKKKTRELANQITDIPWKFLWISLSINIDQV